MKYLINLPQVEHNVFIKCLLIAGAKYRSNASSCNKVNWHMVTTYTLRVNPVA